MPRRFWSCRKCSFRNERTASRKCGGCGEATKPKTRVAKHAVTLRDDSYDAYVRVNELAHGVTDESCAVCGKPRAQEMRHHRDHGHHKEEVTYGKPRGLACFSCNRLMPRELTATRAVLIAAYLTRAENFYVQEQAA